MDIDHSGPRLRRLLLHSLLIENAPPSLPDAQCTSWGGSPLMPRLPSHQHVSARDHPPIWESPVSIPAYRRTFTRLPLTSNFQIPIPLTRSCPLQTCLITVATAPILPPKFLLTWPSSVVQLPPDSTTAPSPPPPLISRLL